MMSVLHSTDIARVSSGQLIHSYFQSLLSDFRYDWRLQSQYLSAAYRFPQQQLFAQPSRFANPVKWTRISSTNQWHFPHSVYRLPIRDRDLTPDSWYCCSIQTLVLDTRTECQVFLPRLLSISTTTHPFYYDRKMITPIGQCNQIENKLFYNMPKHTSLAIGVASAHAWKTHNFLSPVLQTIEIYVKPRAHCREVLYTCIIEHGYE